MKLIIGIILLYAASALAYRGDTFTKDFFKSIVSEKTTENVVFSPVSVAASAAAMFFGAGGDTEQQIRHSIGYPVETKDEIARNFREFLRKHFKAPPNGSKLTIANKMYVNENVNVNPEFARAAEHHFGAPVEAVKFADLENTVGNVNAWVENQTHKRIKHLLSPTVVNNETTSVLVSAIYFQDQWQLPFSQSYTDKYHFFVSKETSVVVDFMHNTESFYYKDFPEYDAKAVALPYKNSNLAMLIILPNKVDGLKYLEEKLSFADFTDYTTKMKKCKIDLALPKFEIVYDIDLKKPIDQMGMSGIFNTISDFSGIFSHPTKVSEGFHKALIIVNEYGSDVPAFKVPILPYSWSYDYITEFRADHPFVFAITDGSTIFLAGHIVRF